MPWIVGAGMWYLILVVSALNQRKSRIFHHSVKVMMVVSAATLVSNENYERL